MKTYCLFLLAIAVVVCLGFGITFGQNAKIVSWNIKGFTAIEDARASRIAKAINRLSPDVVLFSEVNPDEVASGIATQLTGYRSLILPQPANQNIAIVFKNSVSVSNLRFIAGSDDNNTALRKALAANVKVRKFDFILIGVHMKSSRPEDLNDPNDPQNVRSRQARAIANFIRNETSGSEKDVLVVGDYNMIPGEDNPNFRAMSPGSGSNEFLRFVSTESVIGQVSHISSCPNGKPKGNLLDGFAITKTFTREYISESLIIIKPNDAIFTDVTNLTCSQYADRMSDHLPLMARFRTNHDDD